MTSPATAQRRTRTLCRGLLEYHFDPYVPLGAHHIEYHSGYVRCVLHWGHVGDHLARFRGAEIVFLNEYPNDSKNDRPFDLGDGIVILAREPEIEPLDSAGPQEP